MGKERTAQRTAWAIGEALQMTVIEMVAEHLRQNGYDGLYDAYGECACEVDDLAPCGHIWEWIPLWGPTVKLDSDKTGEK